MWQQKVIAPKLFSSTYPHYIYFPLLLEYLNEFSKINLTSLINDEVILSNLSLNMMT